MKGLESRMGRLAKEKEEIFFELENIRNNNVVLKEERDDLEAEMFTYKSEVDHVIASGNKIADGEGRRV